MNNIQGKTQLNALAAPPGWPVPASLLPWDDSWNRTWPNATWTPTPHGAGFDTPLVDQQFQIDDTPGQSVWGLPGQPPAVWGNIPVTLAGVQIVYKFTTCFAVRTEALGATNPDSRYFGLATDGWTCDMSGTFPNGTYSTTGANWTGAVPSPNPSTSNYTVLAAPYLLPQDLFNVPVVNSYLTSTSWDWDPLPTQ